MAAYIKGDAVENATSYELYEKTVAGGTQPLSEIATLNESAATSKTSAELTSNTVYFTYTEIPITAEHSYQVPYGRRLWTFDANGDPVRTLALHTDVTDYTFTAEDGEVSCSVAFSYSDVATDAVTITDLIDTEYYNLIDTNAEINFEVSALGLAAGDHTFVVKAKADGYTDSEYSNEVTYTAE